MFPRPTLTIWKQLLWRMPERRTITRCKSNSSAAFLGDYRPWLLTHGLIPSTMVRMVNTQTEPFANLSANLHDSVAEPINDVFDLKETDWSYKAIVPEPLRASKLPLP